VQSLQGMPLMLCSRTTTKTIHHYFWTTSYCSQFSQYWTNIYRVET